MPESSPKIMNMFWEDHEKNTYFYYTGKDSVLGLPHPDFIYDNEDKFNYARVAFYTLVDIQDPTTYIHINEKLNITTLPNMSTSTLVSNSQDFDIVIQCSAINDKILESTIRCTVTDHLNDPKKTPPEVYITQDPYIEGAKTRYGLGVWVNITDMRYIMTKIDKSLSCSYIPLDTPHYSPSYVSNFLTTENAEPDTNIVKVLDLIHSRIASNGESLFNNVEERLTKLEEKTEYEPHQYTQNSVKYDPNYAPSAAKVEDTISPTGLSGSTYDRIVEVDAVNKTFSVKKAGIYMIQLKNGFYLDQGESRVDLKVYIGLEEIDELGMSSYMVSNLAALEDKSKVVKNTCSSNVYIAPLEPTDKIKFTATWMDIEGIKIENECLITITALQFNLD